MPTSYLSPGPEPGDLVNGTLAIDWNTLPQPILHAIFVAAGAAAAARAVVATAKPFSVPVRSEDFWVELSQLLWPATTLPPRICNYATAHELVTDQNRKGAWRAWRPEQGAWTWKGNSTRRFYCGRATLLALDEIAEMLHVFVHAVTNYPDLRSASTSHIFKVKRPDWEAFNAGGQRGRLHDSKLQTPTSTVVHASPKLDQTVLHWRASEFTAGFVYVFAYASSSTQSDYEVVPLIDLTELPEVAQSHNLTSNEPLDGIKALRTAATVAGGNIFVAPDHVEGLDLHGKPLYEVAKTLLEDTTNLPPAATFDQY